MCCGVAAARLEEHGMLLQSLNNNQDPGAIKVNGWINMTVRDKSGAHDGCDRRIGVCLRSSDLARAKLTDDVPLFRETETA